jgi:hypothetical protein
MARFLPVFEELADQIASNLDQWKVRCAAARCCLLGHCRTLRVPRGRGPIPCGLQTMVDEEAETLPLPKGHELEMMSTKLALIYPKGK